VVFGRLTVAETLLQFQTPVQGPDGTLYRVRACGSPTADGIWQGWLEFTPLGEDEAIRSGRETTQPNRTDTVYWATGLSPVYLEGALRRALEGRIRAPVAEVEPPHFDGPEQPIVPATTPEAGAHAVLDPFSVFQKGEVMLRKQLRALSSWHLVNIIIEYELSDEPAAVLNQLPQGALIETIVNGVRDEVGAGPSL
jgi:hypothetical protein